MKLTEINYELSKPKRIEVLNPQTNKSFETPAYIDVMSIESNVGKQVQLNIFRDFMSKKENNEEITEELSKEVTSKHLSKLLVGWEGIEDEDGNSIEYSEDKAEEVIRDYEIIYNLVNINSSLMGNFIKE